MGEVGLLSVAWCVIAVALLLPSAERCQAPLSLILDSVAGARVSLPLKNSDPCYPAFDRAHPVSEENSVDIFL